MSDYTVAGVNIAEGNRAVALMAAAVQSTYTPAVTAGLGAFGGCFDLSKAVDNLGAAILVASTDGVGTKTLVAAACNDYRTIGADLVFLCQCKLSHSIWINIKIINQPGAGHLAGVNC
jgi:phosphoribosylformylglycinamidine cyclo-ligase